MKQSLKISMNPVELDGKGAAGRPDYEIYVFWFVQNTNKLRKEELHLLQMMIWNTPEWTRPGGFKHTVREPQTAHQMGHSAKCKRKVVFNCIFISFTAFLLTK